MALEWLEPKYFSLDNNYPIQETSPRPNFSKKPLKRPTLSKPTPRNLTPVSIPAVADDSSGRRLITDLPPALISEILHFLEPKDLGIVSCVSKLLHDLATNHFGWKNFYFERWGPPTAPDTSWKDLFVERELKSKCFVGWFSVDTFHGHTEPVRAVFLLQSENLVFTGGYDSVIRMWDLEGEFLISASRPFGCTIRAIAADSELLAVAGTGTFIHCWRAVGGHPFRFDNTSAWNNDFEFRLWGHEGPITCLALDSARIFSGSWDMSVRVWDRGSLKCLRTLRHRDWVWALVPRGSTVASTAGRDAYVWEIESGDLMNVVHDVHAGNSNALARSYKGNVLFTGGEDGGIHMLDVGSGGGDEDVRRIATWKPHTGPVNALAFEFPWLVSSSSDGRYVGFDQCGEAIEVRALFKG